MNLSLLRRLINHLPVWSCVSVFAFALASCGGGGGGGDSEDETPPTDRPKTMDGIILNLDGSATLEFIRNSGTPGAVYNGDVETGTFFYTATVANDNLKTYDNLNGDKSNFRYPMSVTAASYTYRAINNGSGVLTLTASGLFDPTYTLPAGGTTILNNSWIRLFYSYSPQVFESNTHLAEIGISFTSNGTYVSSDIVTLRLPDSPLVSTLDTVRIPTTLSLATLGPVPVNYNPYIDPLRPSRIAPASLGKRLMKATNSIPDVTKNFTLQFVADAVTPGTTTSTTTTEPVEVGHGLLYVYDPALVPPGLKAVGIALDYTWRRIGGTDKGELVISNIPDDPTLPFDASLNGSMILNFSGRENGSYFGAADLDTSNAADVTGTFILPDDN